MDDWAVSHYLPLEKFVIKTFINCAQVEWKGIMYLDSLNYKYSLVQRERKNREDYFQLSKPVQTYTQKQSFTLSIENSNYIHFECIGVGTVLFPKNCKYK